jgi:peroxiredoxin
MAVLVDAQGKIASEVAAGAPAVLALAGVQAPANGNGAVQDVPVTPKIGDPAPAFTLQNLHGKRVNLSDFRGGQTLLLFWNPGCGFCQRMLDDLKAWEAHPPAGAPRLLVVSTGSVESNQELGLRSTIVLDQNMHVGSTFGANGTPMGVLVDAQGKIASELAVGAPAVLALAGASPDQIKPTAN